MKEVFEICTVLAAMVSIFKIIILPYSGKLAKLFQFAIDVMILAILISPIMGVKPYQIELHKSEDINFEAVQNSSVLEIVSAAEELLEKQISGEIEREFSKIPSKCDAKIDSESFELVSLRIYFSRENVFVSAYEVKEFIKERYRVKCEVVFE